MVCSVAGCGGSLWSGGLCSRHYNRLRTTGTTDDGKYSRASFSERLWRQIEKRGPDECWPWIAESSIRGYGYISTGGKRGKKELAHRAAWIVTHGPIPDGDGYHGTVVMHLCDNRLCCNPAHLRLATQAENVADMHEKGRSYTGPRPVGENHGNAKLTDELVREIRTSVESGAAIARRLGMDRGTINGLRRGKGWEHVALETDPALRRHAGERHYNTTLTAEEVREIRLAPVGGKALALLYGISEGALKDIRAGKSWRHVT